MVEIKRAQEREGVSYKVTVDFPLLSWKIALYPNLLWVLCFIFQRENSMLGAHFIKSLQTTDAQNMFCLA